MNEDKSSVILNNKDLKQSQPTKWDMTNSIKLYEWQEECVKKWLLDKKGTIKVVTGAGKTILALAIIERLKEQVDKLAVVIIVPTIVLQNQWYDEILKNTNLPSNMIGRLGGGYDDGIDDKKQIIIAVLKSASMKLHKRIPKEDEENLLLIVDECHRAGARGMSKIFNIKRSFNLGLSATPEREEIYEEAGKQYNDNYNKSLLGKELGPIVFELNVKDALSMGILPEFELIHIGVPLNRKERYEYEQISRDIRELDKEIRSLSSKRINSGNMMVMMQSYAKKDDPIGILARQYIYKTSKRKRLLYRVVAREEIVLSILEEHIKHNPMSRGIIFHESIDAVMNLYEKLLDAGYPVVVENSNLTKSVREKNIMAFKTGKAKIIVSARSLIEGFNVPETDIGIIAASSTSVRQRIQTLGRVLRKSKSEEDGLSKVYVLYAQDTVDENIYLKANWNQILGAKRNKYYRINEDNIILEQASPPRTPFPSEDEIDVKTLSIGDVYPGEYSGTEYSCDSNGNIFDQNNNVILNPQKITELIEKVKGSYGRFKVTTRKKYVLILKKEGDNWETRYVTQLQENFKTIGIEENNDFKWEDTVLKGIVPNEIINSLEIRVLFFKQKRGRQVITQKINKGEQYAREENALDKRLGANASKLINCLRQLQEENIRITKFFLADNQYAVYLENGKYHYICKINNGLEFP